MCINLCMCVCVCAYVCVCIIQYHNIAHLFTIQTYVQLVTIRWNNSQFVVTLYYTYCSPIRISKAEYGIYSGMWHLTYNKTYLKFMNALFRFLMTVVKIGWNMLCCYTCCFMLYNFDMRKSAFDRHRTNNITVSRSRQRWGRIPLRWLMYNTNSGSVLSPIPSYRLSTWANVFSLTYTDCVLWPSHVSTVWRIPPLAGRSAERSF